MTRPKSELLRVDLELWHPDCWTAEVMDETGAGVLGYGSALDGRRAFERCTIYGDSPTHVADAVEAATASTRIDTVEAIHATPTESTAPEAAIGAFSQDVFIAYEFTEGIGPAFFSRGFVLDGPSRMADGVERWPLLVRANRATLDRWLEEIRREHDASISLERVTPADRRRPRSSFRDRLDALTPRQREAFAIARRNGYYNWPRETSVTDLADELGVSKTTFLEHLRTAENRLLDPSKRRAPSDE